MTLIRRLLRALRGTPEPAALTDDDARDQAIAWIAANTARLARYPWVPGEESRRRGEPSRALRAPSDMCPLSAAHPVSPRPSTLHTTLAADHQLPPPVAAAIVRAADWEPGPVRDALLRAGGLEPESPALLTPPPRKGEKWRRG